MNSNRTWLFILGGLLVLVIGLGLGFLLSPLLGGTDDTNDNTAVAVATEPAFNESTTDAVIGDQLPLPPTVNIPPTSTEVPSVTPVPSETPTAMPTDTATATLAPSLTPTATETPTPTPTATREGPQALANADAGLFAGPGVSYGSVGWYVPAGNGVVVIGRSEDGYWWHVINNENSVEGWAASRFLDPISGDISALAVSNYLTTPVAAFVPPTVDSGAPPPVSGDTAYWNEVEAPGGIFYLSGIWDVEILVRVPAGHNYEFAMTDLDLEWIEVEANRDGYAIYSVNISGMNCGDPLLGNLIVLQNGAQLTVVNEHSLQPGAIFIRTRC